MRDLSHHFIFSRAYIDHTQLYCNFSPRVSSSSINFQSIRAHMNINIRIYFIFISYVLCCQLHLYINTHTATIFIYQGFMLLEMTYRLLFQTRHPYILATSNGTTSTRFHLQLPTLFLVPTHYHRWRWSETGVQVESSKYNSPITSRKIMLPLWPYIEFHWCFLMRCWSIRCFHLRCPVSWDWSLHRKEITLAGFHVQHSAMSRIYPAAAVEPSVLWRCQCLRHLLFSWPSTSFGCLIVQLVTWWSASSS